MSILPVEDPDDPRVAAFRDIRERDLTGREGLFIAEGEVVLNVLLSPQSLCRPRAVLMAAHRIERRAELLARVPDGVPVYAASQAVLDRIAGFELHRGMLALGEKPVPSDGETILRQLGERAVVLAVSGVGNHDNMGGLFRNAAAFGAAAVLRDDRCCDPFYRKSIRVSVGAVLRTPTAISGPPAILIEQLEAAGFEVIALSPSAREPLTAVRREGRQALLVGSEGPGLPSAILDRVRTVGIPMAGGFDSLNVATSAAIALHHVCDPPQP
ncbi:TrmH family RNA methyltransferase [Brevundimonas bacteroides]|uniref:TrmH family RNA methyltransferase n=1 Tax=Brevundimonas bacteroides TaxID=74311 RepID=UPI000496748F|nr:RNA methyltransferase [Brevundimonas bacteroides]